MRPEDVKAGDRLKYVGIQKELHKFMFIVEKVLPDRASPTNLKVIGRFDTTGHNADTRSYWLYDGRFDLSWEEPKPVVKKPVPTIRLIRK